MSSRKFITRDSITLLLDYCVKNDNPLPIFDVAKGEQGVVSVECTVGHVRIKCTAASEEEARQTSAASMYKCIFEERDPSKAVTSLEKHAKQSEQLNNLRFKTYEEFMKKRDTEQPGVLLKDRHMFFTKYPEHIKQAAWDVIRNPGNYCSQQEQAMELFAALRIVPTITKRPMLVGTEKHVVIDCNIPTYDVLFIRSESLIWEDVVTYFSEMLE